MQDGGVLRLLFLIGGALVGSVCAIVQAGRLSVGAMSLPWGLVLSLAALVTLTRAASWFDRSRIGGVLFFIGFLVMTLAAALPGPGDDLVLSSGSRQMAYLGLCAVLGAMSAQWPLPPAAMLDDEQPEVGPAEVPGAPHE